jgi:hypothetical protein
VVDWATLDCLRENQETSEEPKNWQFPEVNFPLIQHPVKSAFEKPRSEREEDVEYQRLSSGVYRRYLKIRLTAYRCEVLGDAWKRAHRHTKNWKSGLVAVKYKREPIMLRYSFWSTGSPSSSASSAVVVLIGVGRGFESSILNFLRMFFVYLAWCIKVPSFACLIWSPRMNYNSPIIDISNSLLISFANLATKEWDKSPKTISSTYT